jgi:hypothetical protein
MNTPAIGILLLCGTASCAWNSEWTFAATEECYDGITHDGPGCSTPNINMSGGEHEAAVIGVIVLGLLLLPVAIDCVCLPIEWVHDQIACD